MGVIDLCSFFRSGRYRVKYHWKPASFLPEPVHIRSKRDSHKLPCILHGQADCLGSLPIRIFHAGSMYTESFRIIHVKEAHPVMFQYRVKSLVAIQHGIICRQHVRSLQDQVFLHAFPTDPDPEIRAVQNLRKENFIPFLSYSRHRLCSF